MNDSELDSITRELLGRETTAIPSTKVKAWMASCDIEVQGAVFSLLHNRECCNRINPPLSFADYRKFHLVYYERCLRENPDGKWCESRYLAAHSLVNWFMGLWRDPTIPREALEELRILLSVLYQSGDDSLRECIITGVLEHLFVDKKVARYFSEWKNTPLLSEAYSEALQYSKQIAKQPAS